MKEIQENLFTGYHMGTLPVTVNSSTSFTVDSTSDQNSWGINLLATTQENYW